MHTLGGVTNHYPRHVGDITQATFGLSLSEFGAYDRLLDAYYSSETPLPLSQSERWRLAGAIAKGDRAAVDYIVGRFFTEKPDGWHNKRADEEIAAYRGKSDAAKASAKASVESRNKSRSTNAERPLNEKANERSTDVELTNSHKPLAISHSPASDVKRPQSKTVTPAPSEPSTAEPKANGKHPENLSASGAEAWDAYATAYAERYGATPVRNALVNAQIAALLKRIGASDAPGVIRHYLRSNYKFYVSKGHAVGSLLADCEKLRTEWATGREMTESQARQIDKTAGTGNVIRKLIDEAEHGEN